MSSIQASIRSAHLNPSKRFSGNIFTIIVGGGGRRFKAHDTILSESPVFKAMCAGPFRESEIRLIELPDDDPLSFAILLETFYRCCGSQEAFKQLCHDIVPDDEHRPARLADVYIMADKYQVPQVQPFIVDLLKDLDLLTNNPLTFFTIAQTIYRNVPSVQGPFPVYFRETARAVTVDLDGATIDKVYELIHGGGSLAMDLYSAKVFACLEERERTEALMETLERERVAAAGEQERLKKLAADNKTKLEMARANEKMWRT